VFSFIVALLVDRGIEAIFRVRHYRAGVQHTPSDNGPT
jgi:hypothetical protein